MRPAGMIRQVWKVGLILGGGVTWGYLSALGAGVVSSAIWFVADVPKLTTTKNKARLF